MNYIIRDNETPMIGAVYTTENDMLIHNAALHGPQFDKDNERVYGIIKQLILEVLAWSFITFEHLINILTKAYNDLQCFGEPVLEAKKVGDLLVKITDPRLEAVKQTVKITAGYKYNFAAAVNFLAESVIPLSKSTD